MTKTKNYYKIDGNIIMMRLNRRNTTCLWTIFDKTQLSKLTQYKWYASRDTNTWYVKTHVRLKSGRETTITMHRLIMGLKRGDQPQIDHINHNGLDNRNENLRTVSASQNQHNRSGKIRNLNRNKFTSYYPGVAWHKNRNRWQASIKLNMLNIYLGIFDTELEAANAYLRAKTIRDAGGSHEEIRSHRHSIRKT